MNHLGDTNKMVDTPRTNQVSIRQQYGDEWDWCRADFARILERELNAAHVEIERLTNKVSQLYEGAEEQKQRIKRLEEAHSWRWRPIETAPHNHTWVLGYDEKDGETGMIIFNRGDESEPHWTDGMREWSPTHWMPLPEEPKAKEAKL